MTELCIYQTTSTVLQNDLIIVVFAKLSRQNKEREEHMVVNIKDIYDILSKHYERHSSLFLTREAKSKYDYFYNFSCPYNAWKMIEAMNAMSKSGEMPVKSIEAKFYDKKISAYRCEDYMVRVSERETPNSYYISLTFYGITGVVVKKAYGKYEAKINYNPKHLLSIYINCRTGDLYGKGVKNRATLYPLSFSSYVNKLLLHSEVFKGIFIDILMLCSNGQHIMKDIIRTINEEGYVAMPITIFDIKKHRTKDEMIRSFTGTDLPVDFNKRSLNHGYLLTELSKDIPPGQVGYMIQLDKEMVVKILRDIYKEMYSLDDFTKEFIVRYYIEKLGLLNSGENRYLIRDYIRLAKDHDQPVSINFKTANRLVREHNRLARLYNEKKLSAEFSQPLIAENSKFAELRQILPDEFEWITTTKRLFEEGTMQDNCVFSYRDLIRNDRLTIYHWSIDDRDYTIEFRRSFDGKYTIKQMLQAKNRQANPADVEHVKRCLGARLGNHSESNFEYDPDFFEALEGVEDDFPF